VTEVRSVPVLFDFDYTRPQGRAEFDTSTSELTIRIRRRTHLWEILAGDDTLGVVVALSVRRRNPMTDPPTPKPSRRSKVAPEEVALDVLRRLSEDSTDGRLRDAIAQVRSALHDDLESRE
jgi:hypothetical protein